MNTAIDVMKSMCRKIWDEMGDPVYMIVMLPLFLVAVYVLTVIIWVCAVGQIIAWALPWKRPWEGWPHDRYTDWAPLDISITNPKRPPERSDWKFVLLLFVMGAVPIGSIYYVAFN